MASDTLKEFVENRLRAYDPGIDLSSGSPAEQLVVDPIVRRYQPDPFEMNLETFIDERLTQEYPDLNIQEGSGIRDLVVKPNQLLMDPLIREVQLIKQQQSLANPDLLADSEADALVANFFITRNLGAQSRGVVRMYFNSPVAISVSIGNVFYTGSGLRFFPTALQNISAESMVFNQSGSLYYFDVNVIAELPGDAYNIGKNEVVGVTSLTVAVRVTNLDRFSGGLVEETTEELVARARDSITERSLVVPRGVVARLRDQFSDLRNLQVVGYGDAEMLRDVITGGDLGAVIMSGNDGYTEDDGYGGTTTTKFKTRFGDFSTSFTVGPVENHYLLLSETVLGDDAEVTAGGSAVIHIPSATFSLSDIGQQLVLFGATNPANNGYFQIVGYVSSTQVELDGLVGVVESGIRWMRLRPYEQYLISEILDDQELKVVGNLRSGSSAMVWSIRRKELTISDIPGGIISTDDAAALDIQPNEIHVGGCTDIYVSGSTLEEKTLVINAISDESPLIVALTGSTDSSSEATKQFFRDSTQDFPLLGAKAGYSLVIHEGADAGTKQILRVGLDPTGTGGATGAQYLQISPAITSTASNLRYSVIDDIDIDLNQPRTMRGTGIDGLTVLASNTFTTDSAIDFDGLGTTEGDTLRLLEGPDKGDSYVQSITGTGNRNLVVSKIMTSTETDIGWEVFRAQTGLDLPLARIKTIDILDSSEQPTGDTIPYADPIDSRSTAFANAGKGTKLSITDGITGIVGSVDITSLTLPTPCSVQISVNGSTTTVTLNGLTGLEAVDAINTVIPTIADTIDIDGEVRITLRSSDRWLRVVGGTSYALLGLALGDDNRQIKSAGTVSDWTAAVFDLKAKTDSVTISTGNNIGNLYLVDVDSGRILVTTFDEEDGSVRFLLPNINVALSVGSRSIGTARVYFLEPTSFEVRGAYRPALKNVTKRPANLAVFSPDELASPNPPTISEDELPVTYFTATLNGAEYRFFPDPALLHQVIPDPSSDVPNNLVTTSASYIVSSVSDPSDMVADLGKNSRNTQIDFLTREIRVGDKLQLTYQPIQGVNDIAPPFDCTDLQGKTLVLSLDGAPFKTMTFSDQVTSVANITSEINAFYGATIAFIETIGAEKFLRFEADFEIVVSGTGTANGDAAPTPTLLGLGSATVNNVAAAKIDGYYTVSFVGASPFSATRHDQLMVSDDAGDAPSVTGQAQHFTVLRPGVQRIHSTTMNTQTELGLYYMDVELVSEGSGNAWNIPADTAFVVTGHESDGYRLTVVDDNFSFSVEEQVRIEFSRRILTVGQSDRVDLATQLAGQNIRVNYDRAPIVESVQAFVSSDLDRVLNASILVRHLLPTFVNFDLSYRGGSTSDVVLEDVMDYLYELDPDDYVLASSIQDKALRRGATYVYNPVTLVLIIHNWDRSISATRSTNYVTKGRLSTFFPGTINVSRAT